MVGNYQYRQLKYTIFDFGTINLLPATTFADTIPLKREKRIARYNNPKQGYEYVSKFLLDGKIGYCIEPYVLVILDGNGNGPQYTIKPSDLDPETLNKVGRIIHYGYGHPLTGSTDETYLATQLLIWQHICPQEYQEIMASLQWCTNKDQVCASVSGMVDVSATMDHIMNLVHNYDTTPSFASQWHDTLSYELDWNETLILTDDGSTNLFHPGSPVIDWFEPFPNESHKGINIKQEGNQLKIDIDDLYYEGYDSPKGKTLTFKRKDAQYQSWLNNVLLYTSEDSQKIMGIAFENPTPSYSLAFKLKTANIEIDKLDEYYHSQNFSAGTQFVIGWQEDPTHQYRFDGNKDRNWEDIYNFNVGIKPDLYGGFNYVDGKKSFYPIMEPDNTNIRVFEVGNDGKAHIDNLLPPNKNWWIMEWKVSNPYKIDARPFLVSTKNQNSTASQQFVNQLRDIDLSIVKTASDDPYLKLNDATFEVYEIADLELDPSPTLLGPLSLDHLETKPKLTYNQLLAAIPEPAVDKSFFLEGYRYTIKKIEHDAIWLLPQRYDDYNTVAPITFDQLPTDPKPHDKFTIDNNGIKEYEIIKVTPNTVTFKHTDTTQTLQLTNIPYPQLSPNSHLEFAQKSYTVKQAVYDKGKFKYLEVYPATTYTLANPYQQLSWEQLPNDIKDEASKNFEINDDKYVIVKRNPHQLMVEGSYLQKVIVTNDSLDLNLAMVKAWIKDNLKDQDLESIPLNTAITINDQTYTILAKHRDSANQIDEISLQTAVNDNFIIKVLEPIKLEDFPQTITSKESFSIVDIIAPKYLVSDESGNQYQITVDGNYIFNDQKLEPTSDNSIINYWQLTNNLTQDPNIYCQQPDDIFACPLHTTREHRYTKIIDKPYELAQFNDLAQAALASGKPLAQYAKGETINLDEQSYQIIEPLASQEADHLKVATSIDEQIIEITLYKDQTITTYQEKKVLSKSFTIQAITPKEYIVKWQASKFNDHIVLPEITFQLKQGQDLQYALNITYDQIPNIHKLKPNDTFTIDEQSFTVISNYPDLQNIVIKNENGQIFFLDPQATSKYDVISYDQVSQLEKTQQKPWCINDQLTLDYQRPLVKGDDITINNKKYTILSKSNDNDIIVGFALEDNAPFSYQEILDLFKTHSKIQVDDETYIIKKDDINQEKATIIQDSKGNTYHYYRYHLTNKPSKPTTTDSELIKVSKPTSIRYQDIIKLFAFKLPQENTRFIFEDDPYVINKLNQHSMTIQNLSSKETLEINYPSNPIDDYVTYDKYFINTQKTYDLSAFLPNSEHYYLTCDDPSVLIDNHIIKVDSMKTFDINIHYGHGANGITYEQIIKQLGSKPKINDTFTNKKRTYTVADILQNDDVDEALIITCPNALDTTKINRYYLPIPSPISKNDIPPIHSDLHDSFKVNGIKYTIEKIIINSDGTKDFKVSCKDQDGNKQYYLITNKQLKTDPKEHSIYQIINFTTSNQQLASIKKLTTLPLFKGKTGKNQLRITDPSNHQHSQPFYPVTIYSDPAGTNVIKKGYSDHWGMFDVDDLSPGTYFYNQPNSLILKEFTVYDHPQIDGQVNIQDLKWGRKYLACETQLPLGYDFRDANQLDAKDICFSFDSKYAEKINVTYENVLNTKRKLDLEVVKVDQDDQTKLLNGAIFTVMDVSDEGHDVSKDHLSTFPYKITFQDIPADLKINQQFSVWPDDHSVQFTYEILAIENDHILVKCLDDQMEYHVDKNNINHNVPLTYQDILKNCPKIAPKARFKAFDKQDGNIQTYQIIDIIYAQDPAIWQPTTSDDTSANTIMGYKLININDNNHMVIEVKNDIITMPQIKPAKAIGTFVSGGIYRQLTTSLPAEPFIMQDILTMVQKPKINYQFTFPTLSCIQAPSFQDIPNDLKIDDIFKFNHVDFTLIYRDEQKISLKYQSFNQQPKILHLHKTAAKAPMIQALVDEKYVITSITTDYQGLRYEDIPNIQNLKPNDIITIKGISYKVVNNDIANDKISLQNASDTIDGKIIFEGPIETYIANQDFNEKILNMEITNLSNHKRYYVFAGQTYTYIDVPMISEPYEVMDKTGKVVLRANTNDKGEIIVYGLPEADYQLHYLDKAENFTIKHGAFTIKDLTYGSKLKVCEIHSPLGYIIGNACETIDIVNDNDKIVKNQKTNQKIVINKKKKITRIRKMGED
ncbi:MAG: Cys-Gln thioester bond-forming surface protein [Erysipelotrichaceae bacterium]|nr:Cys-Gln thioester bond-forming surface protein [Erysipelotrichaceae bacterium]MDY5251513.1 Cys-Gln thioester bond-forming surface protein [Erysipelotrichaceae bacterium]